MSEEEFALGYRDGYDLTAPEPSGNRSHCYRHSFAIGRAEREGRFNDLRSAGALREAAEAAAQKDAQP